MQEQGGGGQAEVGAVDTACVEGTGEDPAAFIGVAEGPARESSW